MSYLFNSVQIRSGQTVKPDSWKGMTSTLISADDFDKQYFGERISGRLPSPSFLNIEPAVKIEITGRKVIYEGSDLKVRCKVTWLRDNPELEEEPSSGGWLYVTWNDVD